VRVVALLGGRELQRRLLALGLRLGSVVTVVQHRGRGLVVSQGETRIALGGGVAEKIRVERLADAAPEDRA
jgi:ferrous iron transport protein A